ncbi:MAG: phosphatidylglycerophosphatase A [Pyrinomonadaceae bacterium]|nr:phosphatidylglycerophosphatase A [Pyrinomonadaceae bacterium]MCX7639502.1 phosphatidylglycerophosphatase A [Pyrinomonadaceae bacterium]MDW8304447.1 phosphatidylglycerophosphatase A [Acidobacteriota bacterium]
MSNYNKAIHIAFEYTEEKSALRRFRDRFAVVLTTLGIGYLPLIPGTLASAFTVGIYFFIASFELSLIEHLIASGYAREKILAWLHFFNLLVFLVFCLVGIWASGIAVDVLKDKDPKQAVIDEVIGQMITFLFVPFSLNLGVLMAGFVLFRIFDIWKPYPINSLQNLPSGLGVCADDILAGVYAGVVLSFIYAITF